MLLIPLYWLILSAWKFTLGDYVPTIKGILLENSLLFVAVEFLISVTVVWSSDNSYMWKDDDCEIKNNDYLAPDMKKEAKE